MLPERRSVVFRPSEISPIRRLSSWVLGIGLVRAVILITLISMGCSMAYTVITLHLANVPIGWLAYTIALTAPALVASTLSSMMLRSLRELERMRDEMEKHAEIDGLTGVYNRHHFMELADYEFGQARQFGTSLSLLIIDVDYFKRINDDYGHQCGEMVLCEIVRICNGVLRSADVLARYGGDEFIVLLPLSTQVGANAISERLCKKMSGHIMQWKDVPIQITVSIGVVEQRSDTNNLPELISAAERALYCAKAAGGNQICSVVTNSTEEPLRRF